MKFGTWGLTFGGGGLIFGENFVLVSRGLIFGGPYIQDFKVCVKGILCE